METGRLELRHDHKPARPDLDNSTRYINPLYD
jgi:hypothetical protein